VFAGTWLAYAGFYLCRKNFSVLMPLLSSDLGYSTDNLAELIFVFSATYAVGQFTSGMLADRLGAKRIVAWGMVASALCSASMAGAGWAGALAFWLIGAAQGMNGFAQSCGWPGLVKITGAWFDPQKRGVLMGWWTTNYVVGGFAATILATWFATGPVFSQFGWKPGAVGPAILLIAVCFLFAGLVKERPQSATKQTVAGNPWKEVLASPALWGIAVAYFCLKLTRYTFLYWLPLYMVQRLSYGAGEAGYASSVYELIGFAGVPLAGYVSDRLMGGRRFPVAIAMLCALAVTCVFFTQLSALGPLWNLAVIGAVGIFTFGPDTLLSGAATQDSVSPESTATAAGFVNGVGSVGQLCSPFLVAVATRWVGWDGLFGTFVVSSLVGALALIYCWRHDIRTQEVSAAHA
jgi:OPA family sugar phosphate sensor protein UhpC-like MFS transporter